MFLRCVDSEPVLRRMRLRLDGALGEYSNAGSGLEDLLRQSGHLEETTGLAGAKDDRAVHPDLVTEARIPVDCRRSES